MAAIAETLNRSSAMAGRSKACSQFRLTTRDLLGLSGSWYGNSASAFTARAPRNRRCSDDGLDPGNGRGAARRGGPRAEADARAAAARILQHVARDRPQLRRQGRPGTEADARAALAAGHQPDGGNPHLDGLPRAARRQDRLDESAWRALEGDLLGGRSATLRGASALAIRAIGDRADAQQAVVQSQPVEAQGDRAGRWRVSLWAR